MHSEDQCRESGLCGHVRQVDMLVMTRRDRQRAWLRASSDPVVIYSLRAPCAVIIIP